MAYRVVRYFEDLQDNNFAYHAGEIFPREGKDVSVDRINELATDRTKQNTILIVKEDDEVEEVKADEQAVEETVETPADGKETEDSLSGMTTKEIKALAAERGYKITKCAKADVIDQFLKQQG